MTAPPTAGPMALCLTGPTASGKSAVALALAHELPLEIISVDSALVYRGMDIGTAKPTLAERASVPHHLIDILDAAEAYSAARFIADATRCVSEVRARGRLPLLVGGTMLYFKALREGLHAMPASDAAVRAAIDRRAATASWPALHAELAQVDAATAARLAPHDAQRIQRALEVWQLSGRPLSAWHADKAAAAPAAAAWPMVSLEPASRAWLHERIAQRLATMVGAGLLDEVRALRERGDLHAGMPAMRCVGYRQAWTALDSGLVDGNVDGGMAGRLGSEASGWMAGAVAATRQLAKRQLTWLRSMPSRHVVVCDEAQAQQRAVQRLKELANGP